ncbi:MAG: hypothetical protein GQ535_10730 [Rhodobacteraceae bacterium]|nr:hypothetical protein [Paracoccaceae bacterium]
MSDKKMAVLVVHGMGSQGLKVQPSSDIPTYSKQLRQRLRKLIGAKRFDETIAWREVVWADVLQDRQKAYLGRIKRKTRSDGIRAFMLRNFSDASSYRKTGDAKDNTYELIHDRVRKTLGELEGDVESGAPVLVLAHSLGGHIMSNYIYDHKKDDHGGSPFQSLKTMGGLVTFGCNIPLFTFAYAPEDIFPIKFPGVDLPEDKRLSPWWRNFYDKDDVLGYPLQDISPSYKAMITQKDLLEKPIDVGNLLTSWNPLSHNAYWRDADFIEPTATMIKKLIS